MTFASKAVQAQWNQNNLILARGMQSLVIESKHVLHLRTLETFEDFMQYFRSTALVNRAARRLFDAWCRLDDQLLQKIRTEVTQ